MFGLIRFRPFAQGMLDRFAECARGYNSAKTDATATQFMFASLALTEVLGQHTPKNESGWVAQQYKALKEDSNDLHWQSFWEPLESTFRRITQEETRKNRRN